MKTLQHFSRLRRALLITVACAGIAHADAPRKILIIGDSLSAGYGLRDGEGWVDLLARNLNGAEIVNDSINGDTTAGGAARLPAALRRVQPDWVIIELGGNDGLRGYAPASIRKHLRAMINTARAHDVTPILFGMKLPPNYGAQYTRAFERVFAQVAASTGAAFLPFFLEGLEHSPKMFQPDQIHPSAGAQVLIERNVREFLQTLW